MNRLDFTTIQTATQNPDAAVDYTDVPLDQIDAQLKEIVNAKAIEINEARLNANASYFIYMKKRIACDKVSQFDITSTNNEINNTGVLPAKWPGGWKAKDNTYVPIQTVEDWKAFHSAMYDQGIRNFLKAQHLKQLVKEANSISEILAVNWETPTPYDDEVTL